MRAILALDQGTTSSRAMLFDERGAVAAVAQRELRQIYPAAGWVEHDPREIAATQLQVAAEAIAKVPGVELAAIAITNQRETTMLWDRVTGEPVANAIVWQDRRTAAFCDGLAAGGLEMLFRARTGLVLDPYFSGTKVRWLLDNVPGARAKALAGSLAFGTVDTWLIWQLTAGRVHVTDVTNASRTLMFDIHRRSWDDELLEILQVPRSILPEVVPSSGIAGETAGGLPIPAGIPIAGIAGDQQAALFGQRCTRAGMAKNTYGTGCFIVMNSGARAVTSEHGLLTTLAAGDDFAIEGSVFVAGAAVQWLRDSLGIIPTSADIEPLAASVPDSGGVVFVPGFTGLGAPHWDPYARGAILGITRGTGRAHIARATLEAIALQTADVLEAMQVDALMEITELRVDGGASTNDLLMQIQADVANVRVVRAAVSEITALGAACLAALATNFWSAEEIDRQWRADRVFEPRMDPAARASLIATWREGVERVRSAR
jgi:glycerol kinase